MPQNTFARFKNGVMISGISLNVHEKGQVLYVCSLTSPVSKFGIAGADDNDGLTPDRPLATITKALALSTANRGDKIIVLQGHAETVTAAAGIDFNVAGVDVIGVGTGAQRPTITLTTANTATVQISASDVSINNFLFVGNFLAIATCIKFKNATVAKDVQIVNCEFRDTDSTHGFVKAISSSTTDNNNDGLTVKGSVMYGTGTTATTAFILTVATDRLTVEDNNVNIQGTTATTGALVLATAKALTGAQVRRNDVQSNLTTSSAASLIVCGTGGSGVVSNNTVQTAGGTDLLVTASSGLAQMNNVLSAVADASGYTLPAADA